MSNLTLAEYVWLDAGRGPSDPMARVRSKTRVYPNGFPKSNGRLEWDFDGSSTGQSDGHNADLSLRPVKVVNDPFRGGRHKIVLCEVYDADLVTPHKTNHRAKLAGLVKNATVVKAEPWIGFEQEYMLMAKEGFPLGFHDGTAPAQGRYYCGVGAKEAYGREIMEEHLQACLAAGLWIYGTNAEVCPGQWEYQIGPRVDEKYIEASDFALEVSDHIWLSRYFLHRIAEKHGVDVSLHPKPVITESFNGSGMHTNFSTKEMRAPEGLSSIMDAIKKLEEKHDDHIKVYGSDLRLRLTGHHETAPIDEFRFGTADRGASIRIPNKVKRLGCGYFEDRRPGANADPYQVAAKLIQTVLF